MRTFFLPLSLFIVIVTIEVFVAPSANAVSRCDRNREYDRSYDRVYRYDYYYDPYAYYDRYRNPVRDHVLRDYELVNGYPRYRSGNGYRYY